VSATTAILGALAAPAIAAGPTYVVTGSDSESVKRPQARDLHGDIHHRQVRREAVNGRTNVQIVQRDVVKPGAVVSRELAHQPTYSGLVEVNIGGQSLLIDPYRDMERQPSGGVIDENFSLIKAQRQADVPRPLPQVTIIHGSPQAKDDKEASSTGPVPKAVIPIPEKFNEPEPKRLSPDPESIEPEQDQTPRKMARSRNK
jgi:hypothetical protein